MNIQALLQKALNKEFLSLEEGLFLYENAQLPDLMFTANELRKKAVPGNKVGWIIDRNVNITNVCVAQCKFCNFYRRPGAPDIYTTTLPEYEQKITETLELGGKQLLLQGGLHPKLGSEFYANLFSELKKRFPEVNLHALGPAEIHHIARIDKTDYKTVLVKLAEAGLDSLPGAGAEILSNRVRSIVSKGKCNADQWLNVMREAHKLNLPTSATMMFGHIETKTERIEHLVALRQVQSEKPAENYGFITFVPWPFMDENTELLEKEGIHNSVTGIEYLRTIAISRIMLPNIQNIQASWLTVGKEIGQLCLHAGANDFGSIMIEENVVSAAGATHTFNAESIQKAIKEAGFEPYLRNQKYEPETYSENYLKTLETI
ncbi:MAG TPA: dehypoxanthine futalosine cyclase [Bacteroidales bacterium]|nr:dehypoxanthine futalosine cyclase [Bacteroidales bacterium]